jgi:hypothetical protein
MEVFTSEECVICTETAPELTFDPCHHRCCCGDCYALIEKAHMPCPLCRQGIVSVLSAHADKEDKVVPVAPERLVEFREQELPAYKERLAAGCTKNAGFTGKSKQARAVAGFMGSELERRVLENRGLERMCVPPKKLTFTREGDELVVSYKVGRKAYVEPVPYLEFDEAKQLLQDIGARNVEYLAAFREDCYWILRYHMAGEPGWVERMLKLVQQNGKRNKA